MLDRILLRKLSKYKIFFLYRRERYSILTWKHKLVAGVIIYMLMRDTKAPVLWNDPDALKLQYKTAKQVLTLG